MKWDEERAPQNPSLAGVEEAREGVPGGVTGVEAVHHVEGEVTLAGGEGQEVHQTEGGEGGQPREHLGFVELSGRKLVLNDFHFSFCFRVDCLKVDRILSGLHSVRLHMGYYLVTTRLQLSQSVVDVLHHKGTGCGKAAVLVFSV